MIEFGDCCAPGVRFQEAMFPVHDDVRLRVVSFVPPNPQRPPVVFVPGWITRMEAWRIVLREMTRDFPVYYIETREKSSSIAPEKADYSVESISSDIADMVHALGLADGYVLFGSSLGATVILDAYRHLRSRPKCLVLIGPNAEFRMPWLGKAIVRCINPDLFFSWIKPAVKWYLKMFRLDVKNDPAQFKKYADAIDAADPRKLKKAALAFSRYRVWDKLAAISVPTLVVGGSKDKLHEPEILRRMTEMLPRARYLDLETNRQTHTEAVVEATRQFIDSVDPDSIGRTE
jgi:pimeloyl-ACP methyl ester carboxylesterase